MFHAASIALFNRFFTGRNQGRGQALYSSLSFGAGGAFGAYYSGLAWDSFGPAFAYGTAALLAATSVWLAWRFLRVD